MAIPQRTDKPFDFRFLLGDAHVQQEMLMFVLVSSLDVFMTYILLRYNGQFYESNPVAAFFIAGWGVSGMIKFKFGAVAFVCVLSQFIAQHKPRVARWLLMGSTGVVAIVVVYSLILFVNHAGVEPPELALVECSRRLENRI